MIDIDDMKASWLEAVANGEAEGFSRCFVPDILEALAASQARVVELEGAFEIEAEKVAKANREAKRMDCDCSGEGVGSLGGCFRCRTLDALSTFGWDFRSLSPAPSAAAALTKPAKTVKGESK